jgi:hypothetical protein
MCSYPKFSARNNFISFKNLVLLSKKISAGRLDGVLRSRRQACWCSRQAWEVQTTMGKVRMALCDGNNDPVEEVDVGHMTSRLWHTPMRFGRREWWQTRLGWQGHDGTRSESYRGGRGVWWRNKHIFFHCNARALLLVYIILVKFVL